MEWEPMKMQYLKVVFFFFNDENEKAFKSRKEALNANKLFGRNETSYQNKNKNIFWETFLLFV